MTTRAQGDPSNPILNSPYEEPAYHYATDVGGNLNYADIRNGRHNFSPDTPTVPLAQLQPGMFGINELQSQCCDQLIYGGLNVRYPQSRAA